MAFALYTPSFSDREPIPLVYTCDGEDKSPKLSWSGQPHGTSSYALVMHDPDAPNGDYTHWMITDIPATIADLDEAAQPGDAGVDHINSFGKIGYGGPCPPRGHGSHRYYFDFYALNVPTVSLPAGSSRQAVDEAIKGHILAKTTVVGTYERK